jgi:hypothetical protein
MVTELAVQNTDFPFPSQPPSDEVLTTLVDALRATMACPPSPAIAALAENTLKAVHRIQHGAHLAEVSEYVSGCVQKTCNQKRDGKKLPLRGWSRCICAESFPRIPFLPSASTSAVGIMPPPFTHTT